MDDAIKEFNKYTANYLGYHEKVVLKINHTFRVVDLCERIAKSLNLSDEDIEIAKLCGLLHDIARFEQLKIFNTLGDSISIDHGDLGVYLLKSNNFIRKFNKNEEIDNLIYKVIRCHNKYKIDKNLSDREILFCNIIRDADKIDILNLYVKKEVIIDTNNETFSDKVYDTLINKKVIFRGDKCTKADDLAVSLGFVFDLNYLESFKILKENNYINDEIDYYISNCTNNDLVNKLKSLKDIINKYVEGKCL